MLDPAYWRTVAASSVVVHSGVRVISDTAPRADEGDDAYARRTVDEREEREELVAVDNFLKSFIVRDDDDDGNWRVIVPAVEGAPSDAVPVWSLSNDDIVDAARTASSAEYVARRGPQPGPEYVNTRRKFRRVFTHDNIIVALRDRSPKAQGPSLAEPGWEPLRGWLGLVAEQTSTDEPFIDVDLLSRDARIVLVRAVATYGLVDAFDRVWPSDFDNNDAWILYNNFAPMLFALEPAIVNHHVQFMEHALRRLVPATGAAAESNNDNTWYLGKVDGLQTVVQFVFERKRPTTAMVDVLRAGGIIDPERVANPLVLRSFIIGPNTLAHMRSGRISLMDSLDATAEMPIPPGAEYHLSRDVSRALDVLLKGSVQFTDVPPHAWMGWLFPPDYRGKATRIVRFDIAVALFLVENFPAHVRSVFVGPFYFDDDDDTGDIPADMSLLHAAFSFDNRTKDSKTPGARYSLTHLTDSIIRAYNLTLADDALILRMFKPLHGIDDVERRMDRVLAAFHRANPGTSVSLIVVNELSSWSGVLLAELQRDAALRVVDITAVRKLFDDVYYVSIGAHWRALFIAALRRGQISDGAFVLRLAFDSIIDDVVDELLSDARAYNISRNDIVEAMSHNNDQLRMARRMLDWYRDAPGDDDDVTATETRDKRKADAMSQRRLRAALQQ